MLRTYDFILKAKRDSAFMERLKKALSNTSDSEICTDTHRLTFHAGRQTVILEANSASVMLQTKIVPKEIKYQALLAMLDGNWDDIDPEDITAV